MNLRTSHHEQMVLALRYVNKKGEVNERVITILRVGDTFGGFEDKHRNI